MFMVSSWGLWKHRHRAASRGLGRLKRRRPAGRRFGRGRRRSRKVDWSWWPVTSLPTVALRVGRSARWRPWGPPQPSRPPRPSGSRFADSPGRPPATCPRRGRPPEETLPRPRPRQPDPAERAFLASARSRPPPAARPALLRRPASPPAGPSAPTTHPQRIRRRRTPSQVPATRRSDGSSRRHLSGPRLRPGHRGRVGWRTVDGAAARRMTARPSIDRPSSQTVDGSGTGVTPVSTTRL